MGHNSNEDCWIKFGELLFKTITWFERRGAVYRRRPWVERFIVEYSRGVGLDLGSGTASTTRNLLGKGYLERLILLDLSLPSLESACRGGDPRLMCIHSDFFDEVFIHEAFDTVYLLSILHHIPSSECRNVVYRNVYKYLKTNGHAIATVWKPKLDDLMKTKTYETCGIGSSDILIKDRFGERYYHLFKEEELIREVVENNYQVVENGLFTQSFGKEGLTKNIYVVFRKKA